MINQHLQHGKSLCGKVFSAFVETFNWLVDFSTNLKGDADVNDAIGRIKVDRTDPAHPVIRFIAAEEKESTSSVSLSDHYWILTYNDDIAQWSNCVLQVGLDIKHDEWGDIGGTRIENPPKNATWYLNVNAETGACAIRHVVQASNIHPRKSAVPESDFANNIINIYLGDSHPDPKDSDVIVTSTIDLPPVIYIYL